MALAPAAMVAEMLSPVLPPLAMMGTSGNCSRIFATTRGVVLNSPISDLNLLAVSRVVDIPVIITVTKENTNIQSRIDSGASILNVACSTDTPRVVAKKIGRAHV